MNPPDISPIRGTLKHQTTPVRPRRKTSRKDQTSDVHSSCSTPNRVQPSLPSNGFNSPSDSFPYSQENRPDVYWDYTSPKLPKGSKRKEIKITVDEFLKNLTTQRQVPECSTQSSHYIKLLEKWMTKQNTPTGVKLPPKNVKRHNKRGTRRVFEDIKQFVESIQKKNEDEAVKNEEEKQAEKCCSSKASASNYINISLDKKSFLDGDSSQNDSTDDLWGDVDNSFIIKATQQLDVCSKMDVLDKNSEIVSSIPETLTGSSKVPSKDFNAIGLGTEINFNDGNMDSDYQAQILLSQIINCEWDSASDDEWDNGFIESDEALSLIPEEVLCGSVFNSKQNSDKNDMNHVNKMQNSEDVQSITVSANFKIPDSKNRSDEILFSCESEKDTGLEEDMSEAELFNNFDDASFGDDEAILCKPEVLSWIDEVESQLSQSQKCTPEEIEKKKVEAIQRRKKNKP